MAQVLPFLNELPRTVRQKQTLAVSELASAICHVNTENFKGANGNRINQTPGP